MKKIAVNKMSISKLLAIILISFFYYQPAEAQILKKLKKRVKDASEEAVIRKAEEKAAEETEKVIDTLLNKKIGKKKKSKKKPNKPFDPNSDSNTDENMVSEVLKPWSNYNFVPGDKIIFQDDLVDEENGEFPSRWDLLDGNAENAVLGEENIINFKNKSIIAPLMEGNEYLPDVFTIEFDVYFGDKKGPYTWQYYGIRFANSTGGWYYPDPKKKDYYYPIQIYQHGAYLSAQINEIKKEFKTYEETLKDDGALWRHIAIAFNKRSLKVFVDQHRVLNIPNLGFQPKVFNISAWSYYDDNFIRAVKNIRVAEGGKKLYDRVIADGKFVTRGILFDVNQATLKPESMGVINEVAKMMQEHQDLNFNIEGHTDSDGEEDYNLQLSAKRAVAVKEALIELGIGEERLQTEGKGESVPVAENNSPEGRANNRRVEFIKF